jgi:hypothetical protein
MGVVVDALELVVVRAPAVVGLAPVVIAAGVGLATEAGRAADDALAVADGPTPPTAPQAARLISRGTVSRVRLAAAPWRAATGRVIPVRDRRTPNVLPMVAGEAW